MISRKVTRAGLINISRQLRGEALKGDVAIVAPPTGGLTILPYQAAKKMAKGDYYRGHFDQYNRLLIPERIRALAKIEGSVEVAIQEDGSLHLQPISDKCMVCGGVTELHKVSNQGFLCAACIKRASELAKPTT